MAATGLLVAALLLGPGASSAPAAVEAPPIHLLPGFKRVSPSTAAGVKALTRYLPRKLSRKVRSAHRDEAAAAGNRQRVQVTALELRKTTRARRIVARSRAGARKAHAKPRPVRVGDGGWLTARSEVTVVWRSRSRVGIVRLSGRGQPSLARAALAFARFADVELRARPPETAWERVLDRVRSDGTVSRRTALQAFSLAYGRLPGVKRPSGRRGAISDGNLALSWILRHRSSLTKAQRRAVDRVLDLRSGAARARAADDDLGFTVDPKLSAAVKQYVDAIGAHIPQIGWALPDHVAIVAGTTDLQPLEDATALADAAPVNTDGNLWSTKSGGAYDYCRVRVLPNGQALSGQRFKYMLAHEAFHCVQFHIIGPGWPSSPGWLKEGTATWGGLKVAPVPFQSGLTWLPTYIKTPGKGLFQRTYDAVGFFGHIDDTLGSFWPRVVPTLTAKSPELAFDAAGGTVPNAFTSWGSSLFRLDDLGPPWQMSSPQKPPGFSQLNPGGFSLIDGSGHLAAKARATAQAGVEASPGRPLLRVLVQGTARMRPLDGSGKDIVLQGGESTSAAEVWLCTRGECTCPQGTVGGPPSYRPWKQTSVLALSGQPSSASVSDHSLDEFCEPPLPGSGDPLDCFAGGCGSSNGDPHLVTFDGRYYDFQAVGEFTLLKSRSGDLEVQARQELMHTVGGVPDGTVSIDTALAMQAERARVGIYATKKGMRLRVNGRRVKPPTGGETLSLKGGGKVAERAGQLAVLWPDGSEARVWSVGKYGVAMAMLPAASRAGALVGLLGDFDGEMANDFATRGGEQLSESSILGSGRRAFKRLYSKFGDSWRISQRASLFDYERGRSTRDYTRRGFPSRRLEVRALPRKLRKRAERICREAGVRDPSVLENCILDVAATGKDAFARDAATLQATAKRRGGWTRLSSALVPPGSGGTPTLATATDRVVAAYGRGGGAVEATTFAPDPGGARNLTRVTAASGWQDVGNLFLLRAPAGGLQLFFYGHHSVNPDDPLNGAVLLARGANGGFGAPTRIAKGDWLGLDAATATAGGVPIWATFDVFNIYIWRGTKNAVSHDLGGFASGVPLALARDASGRIWLAWEDYTGPNATAELYMGELDPATGEPAPGAAPRKVPAGSAETFDGAQLACGAKCRLVFARGDRLLSWAPGEGSATTVVAGGADLGLLATAVAPTGRLWVAWGELGSAGRSGVNAKLGNASGAGGSPVVLRSPKANAFPGSGAAVALPGRLVLAVNWLQPDGSAAWTAIVPGE